MTRGGGGIYAPGIVFPEVAKHVLSPNMVKLLVGDQTPSARHSHCFLGGAIALCKEGR